MALAEVRDTPRRQVGQVPAEVQVVVRVRHTSLAGFPRIREAERFRSLGAAQQLLAFGTEFEVVSPAEPRESLARVAAETAALYAPGISP
ncbi:hypothetical protein OG762_44050 [Streptomyces sp. NBC_01136]|uniref:hypothetical protein n=1 Tax=unclassified Streptomyces TaxID=2593676 RepID=UPI00325649BF|nr:hypothetical protein OG762_44050 [Streptomyces sp. NBC_01136]